MKKRIQFITGTLCFVLLGTITVWGQQNVFSRSEVTTGNWGDAQNPWYYGTDAISKGDPDDGNSTANLVKIGHNNNTSMTLNGRAYQVRELEFEVGATAPRTIGGNALDLRPNGGTPKIINNSSGVTHTFNNDIAAYATFELNPVNGNLIFNSNIYQNGNFLDVYGNSTLNINGNLQNGSGAGGVAVKSSTVQVVFSTDAKEYTGPTYIENGELSSSVDLSTSLIQVQDGAILTVTENISVNSLEIQSGGTLTIEAGDTLTIRSGSYYVNKGGTVNLNSTGAIKYERQISGAEGWRMLSTPTSDNT